MVFTTTLVRILCGSIYRHFTTFYLAFAAASATALMCTFSGSGKYRHFSQFHRALIFRSGIYRRISIVPKNMPSIMYKNIPSIWY